MLSSQYLRRQASHLTVIAGLYTRHVVCCFWSNPLNKSTTA